ncbi:hypothetical protein EUV02_08470 [Polymorphobacter arshaanensis]|uniref:MFS transporter n=1 Tax=Glacieibacterium arshaanense TaxID=2511025 RepID=A0A4Y9EPF4_9SPHN|nr:hypothetical protein [Polymorphobacter arshaanensis]TFU03219.1 hypothetical protein EUV02_08470 [Polymorphobacter arshaanensis]
MAIIRLLLTLQPLLFGLGFLAPLAVQIITRTGLTPPFGLTPMLAGLLVGGTLGAIANLRGSWI